MSKMNLELLEEKILPIVRDFRTFSLKEHHRYVIDLNDVGTDIDGDEECCVKIPYSGRTRYIYGSIIISKSKAIISIMTMYPNEYQEDCTHTLVKHFEDCPDHERSMWDMVFYTMQIPDSLNTMINEISEVFRSFEKGII